MQSGPASDARHHRPCPPSPQPFRGRPGRQAPFLDEPRVSVTIDTGEVTVDLDSLNAIMARALHGHSNVQRVQISIDDDRQLRQSVVTKAIRMPFELKATANATPGGQIRTIHPESVKGSVPRWVRCCACSALESAIS